VASHQVVARQFPKLVCMNIRFWPISVLRSAAKADVVAAPKSPLCRLNRPTDAPAGWQKYLRLQTEFDFGP
jgi:hypothetical protein